MAKEHELLHFTTGRNGADRSGTAFPLNAAIGKPLWAVDLPRSYEPDVDYGFPWSPKRSAMACSLEASSPVSNIRRFLIF